MFSGGIEIEHGLKRVDDTNNLTQRSNFIFCKIMHKSHSLKIALLKLANENFEYI